MNKIFLVAVCAFIFLSCDRSRKNAFLSKVSYLPYFTILLPDSETVFHSQNITKGKPVVIIYFRPDCPHCQAETKSIIDNIGSLHDFEFYFLSSATLSEIRNYQRIFRLDQCSNILIGKDYEHSFRQAFHPASVPYIAIYNKEKKLMKIYYGEAPVTSIVSSIHS